MQRASVPAADISERVITMKMLHISDLHLGLKLKEFSMIEDQRYVLEEILRIIRQEQPDCILIAGDVYDKPTPPTDAVRLFDWFLGNLFEQELPVFVISGNHDAAERIAFGSRIMEQQRVFFSPVYDGNVRPVTLHDAFGDVHFYMLPFIRPFHVRRCFEDRDISSYTEAAEAAVAAMQPDYQERNVLIAHQFVTGAVCCDSEEISVGGLENISASVFAQFDYAALGHIHNPQSIKPNIRYCGTPLKYSFSEAGHTKSVTIAELGQKGEPVEIRTIPLVPLHDMREIRGRFDDLIDLPPSEDYLHILLEDEEDVPDALAKLRTVFPRIMKLDYDNTRTRSSGYHEEIRAVKSAKPIELFADFYEQCNGKPMSSEQQEFMEQLIQEIWEGNHETD